MHLCLTRVSAKGYAEAFPGYPFCPPFVPLRGHQAAVADISIPSEWAAILVRKQGNVSRDQHTQELLEVVDEPTPHSMVTAERH